MPLPTKKRTRKPHKDPEVEAVLVLKDRWNLAASTFIYDLIAFKRGLNGRGDSEHRLPPSKISDKLDESIPSLLTRLTGQFRDLAQSGLNVVQKQEELHEKKQGKSEIASPANPAPVQNFQKLLETSEPSNDVLPRAASFQSELVVEGTNPVSRRWWRMKNKNPTLDGMMLALIELRNEIHEMQDAAVTGKADDIQRIDRAFTEIRANLKALSNLYHQHAKELGFTPQDLTSSESAYEAKIHFYKQEFYQADSITGTPHSFKSRFNNLLKLFQLAQNDIDRADIISKIDQVHRELINHYRNGYVTKVKKPWTTVSEFFNLVPTPLPPDAILAGLSGVLAEKDEKLQALAHNFVSRRLKKMKLKSFPGKFKNDKFRAIRLFLYKSLENYLVNVYNAMDNIQNGGSHESLGSSITSLKKDFDGIQQVVRSLGAGKQQL